MTTDATRAATLQNLLELTTDDLDRLVRLVPRLPFDLHDHLVGDFHRETGLFVHRVNRILHEQIWRSLLSEADAEATTLGAFGVDRAFFIWSRTTIGEVTGPGLVRTLGPLRRFLDAATDWPQFVADLNESLRPPRGTGSRKREKERSEARRAERATR